MANEPEFTLRVKVGEQSQDFHVDASGIVAFVGSMWMDRPEYAGVFAAAAQHSASSVRREVAGLEHLPGDSALELAKDPCAAVRLQVAGNPVFRRVASESLILSLINSDPDIAAAVASQVSRFENADMNVLCEVLHGHSDPSVRKALADNDGTPLCWLKKLRDDGSKDVASAALGQLTMRSR